MANNKLWSVLSNAQLEKLAEHKYSATGTSMLVPYLDPFWCWLVLQIPLSVSPNLITFFGLLINLFTSTIVLLESPNAEDPVSLLQGFTSNLIDF